MKHKVNLFGAAVVTFVLVATLVSLFFSHETIQKQQDRKVLYKDWKGTVGSVASNSAFCFVIGGVNPEKPLKYRGFIHNILVATRLFQTLGSKADVVAFFQLSHSTSATSLPDSDLRPLEELHVKVRYLAPSPTESFYETQMNKFNILTLTEYKRVIFMDGDVIPLCNLDYLFELSGSGVLKPNLVIAARHSPANGGFFMMTPEAGDFQLIQQIIQTRESKPFDKVEGYGHVITPPDEWAKRGERGRYWDFHGGPSDQGLCKFYLHGCGSLPFDLFNVVQSH